MDFDKIYKEAIKEVSIWIMARRIVGYAADDYINDAYIKCVSENIEITLPALSSIAKSMISSLIRQRHAHNFNNKREFSNRSTHVCPICGEDKPSACFGIANRKKTGTRERQVNCYDCQRDVMRKYYKSQKYKDAYSNRMTAEKREYHKKKNIERRKKIYSNPDLLAEYKKKNAEYQRKYQQAKRDAAKR